MKLLFMAFFAIGLCFTPNFLMAQTIYGKISGQVADENGRPVEGATVDLTRLRDSVAIKYELTLADGSFNIGISAAGTVCVKITSIGKIPFKSEGITVDSQHLLIILKPVTMQTSAKTLQEVVITS